MEMLARLASVFAFEKSVLLC